MRAPAVMSSALYWPPHVCSGEQLQRRLGHAVLGSGSEEWRLWHGRFEPDPRPERPVCMVTRGQGSQGPHRTKANAERSSCLISSSSRRDLRYLKTVGFV